jgi:hypothetical protein
VRLCGKGRSLPFYISRVGPYSGTCILPEGARPVTLGDIIPLMSSVRSCAIVLLVRRSAPSARYTGPYSESDANIVVPNGARKVDL